VPLYEYQCDSCGRFEVIQKFAQGPLKVCPTCKQPVQKLPSAPAIQFKGTGWYVTDYARKEASKESKESSKEAKESKESSKESKESKESSKEPSKASSKESSKESTPSAGKAKSADKPAATSTSGGSDAAGGGTSTK
jgi:putative FmdB family regulatory protein